MPPTHWKDELPDELACLVGNGYLRTSLKNAVELHHSSFTRIIQSMDDVPLEVAVLLEDASERYLLLAEQVREYNFHKK